MTNLLQRAPRIAHGLLLLTCVLAGGATQAAAPGPLTLENALAIAAGDNPDARIALDRISAARAGEAAARAAAGPSLAFSAGYMGTDRPMSSFGNILNQRRFSSGIDFNDVPTTDDLNLRGEIRMPLYTGGRLTAERSAARADRDAAELDASAVQNLLAYEVTRTFFEIEQARALLEAARASVHSQETNRATAQQRFDAGSLLKSDLLDIDVRLAEARENVVRSHSALALGCRALATLLGGEQAVEDQCSIAATTLQAPPADAAARRPELDAAEARARAAEARIEGAQSGARPRIDAYSSVDYDHGFVRDGNSGADYSAGLTMRWNAWDNHLTDARVAEARAHFDAAQDEVRKIRLDIDLEVARARLALDQALARLEVSEHAVAQAEESLALTRQRFAGGLALTSQLLDADTALTLARVRRAQAEAERQIAVAALRKALGLAPLDDAGTPSDDPTGIAP